LFLAGCGGAMPSGSTVVPDNTGGPAAEAPSPAPSPPSTSTTTAPRCASQLASGDAHVCAVRGDGAVYCWGLNSSGQLGVGDAVNRAVPAAVALPGAADQVVAGASHACARLTSGAVFCWGENASGQLGDGTTTPRLTPVAVKSLADAKLITAGAEHTCALRATGSIVCWGDDEQGQLGDGRDGVGTRSTEPVTTGALANMAEVSARGDHTCARGSDGSVTCWGSDVSGELGDGQTGAGLHATTPRAIAGLTATSIAAGNAHTCALGDDGSLDCWGNNSSGQLGLGYISWNAPGAVPSPSPLTAPMSGTRLAAGQAHTCARDGSGALWCWGVDGRGQLGNGAETQPAERGVPTAIAVANLVVDAFSAGATHTCAIDHTGAPFCWGGNRNGELGNGGSSDDTPTPTAVALPCP
jgi:alpha-tubulin suppressor-like RCC1 family protein